MKYLFSALLIMFLPVITGAAIVTIEADDFAAGTNISNAYDDIALTALESGQQYDIIYSVPSTHSTGLLGGKSIGYYSQEWWASCNPQLRLDFNGLAKSLHVTALGREGWVQQTFVVKAFAADGEQIGYLFRKTSSIDTRWILMEFPDYQIAYATIYANMPVAFDHIIIDYQPIPEPATALLLGLLQILVSFRRRSGRCR